MDDGWEFTFLKGISLKVNVITRMDFEIAYDDDVTLAT